MTTDPEALARTCAEIMWKDDQAAQQLGIALKEVAPGRAVLGMTIAARMVNGHGSCHGGYIFALADTAFAYACNAYGERAVASHCAITYLRPGKLGDDLIALAEERMRTGRSGIYDVRITRGDGAVIAEFRGHSRVIGSFFPAVAPQGA
ncbi:MAG: hydroxyphenylacetyl-CoA thioesterase PaaI [Acetobacteraceae bacterium]